MLSGITENDLKLLQSRDDARNFPTDRLELSTGGGGGAKMTEKWIIVGW